MSFGWYILIIAAQALVLAGYYIYDLLREEAETRHWVEQGWDDQDDG